MSEPVIDVAALSRICTGLQRASSALDYARRRLRRAEVQEQRNEYERARAQAVPLLRDALAMFGADE